MPIIYQPPTWQGVLVDDATADKWVKTLGFKREPPVTIAPDSPNPPELSAPSEPVIEASPDPDSPIINPIELDEGEPESAGININTATLAELVALPAIGMAKARKLQAKQPNYKSAEDLLEVVPSVDWESLLSKGAIAL